MRKRSVVLEEPESPASASNSKTVVVGWKSICTVHNVADGWSQPGDIDGLSINLPEHAGGGVESKIEKSWGSRWRWNCCLDVWNKLCLLDAASGQVV